MITVSKIELLPSQSGVYIFEKNNIPIYIGKSVNIRTRVRTHIAQAQLSRKEAAIISQSNSIRAITTLSNFDALILEADLIRKYQPKYNVIWKDDKNYLYIKVTIRDACPKILSVRKENDDKSKYFGPFRSSHMTNSLIYELRHVIPFCTQEKIGKRKCFYARIGLCNPCPNYIESLSDKESIKKLQETYRKNISKIMSILSGNSSAFSHLLESRIKRLIEEEKYEEAIHIRDKLLKFNAFLERRSFKSIHEHENVDLYKLYDELRAFLNDRFKYKLPADRYRIECYDISNLLGAQPTGSMVVYQDGEFKQKEYKKFSVKEPIRSDIYMMREVLKRRLQHSEWRMPDLIILDGGKPQLRMIYEYFQESGIDIPLISIAKRPDRILTTAQGYRTIYISRSGLLFKLIQSLRDESHRFAKKYHIVLRNRNLLN